MSHTLRGYPVKISASLNSWRWPRSTTWRTSEGKLNLLLNFYFFFFLKSGSLSDRLIVKPSVARISPFEHQLISILARQLRSGLASGLIASLWFIVSSLHRSILLGGSWNHPLFLFFSGFFFGSFPSCVIPHISDVTKQPQQFIFLNNLTHLRHLSQTITSV